MRKVLISLFGVALVAGLAMGEIETKRYKADFTTAALSSNEVSTAYQMKGKLAQIDIVPSGTFTADVAVTYTPLEGTAVNVYTGLVSSQTILYNPGFDRATVPTGAALTNDDPASLILNGGTLTVTSTNVNNTTNTSLVIVVKTEK